MQFKILFFTILFAFSLSMIGCGGTETAVNSPNTNAANTNTAKTNSNNPLAVSTPTPSQTTNNAPTLTPVYKAYCAAMVKKDEAALRKIYSSDTIKDFEEQMKADNVKSLVKFLDEEASLEVCEVRNERINGDEAVAEIIAEWAPNGAKVVFVKESGKWKITNRIPGFDVKKPSATNSSTGK